MDLVSGLLRRVCGRRRIGGEESVLHRFEKRGKLVRAVGEARAGVAGKNDQL